MTTKVIIVCPDENHLDVFVEVIGGDGIARASHHVAQGQAKQLYVFDNQQLRVSEVARKVAA